MRKLIVMVGMILAFGVSAHPGGHNETSIKYEVSLNDIAYNIFGKLEKSMSRSLKESNAIKGTGKVYRVIDGDTLLVNVDKRLFSAFEAVANTDDKKAQLKKKYRSVKIRIASVNTPESVHRIKSKNTYEGKLASRFTKKLAEKKAVSFTCYNHGDYGRPICIVSVGKKDIGYNLILNGHSEYVTAWGNNPYYHGHYKKAEAKSQK